MELDLDLVKKILLDIEEKETADGYKNPLIIEGYTDDQLRYHLNQMGNAGLINGEPNKIGYYISGMTMKGHDFLAQAQNSTVWNATKKELMKQGVSFTINMAIAYMKKLSEGLLGIGD